MVSVAANRFPLTLRSACKSTTGNEVKLDFRFQFLKLQLEIVPFFSPFFFQGNLAKEIIFSWNVLNLN